MAQTLAELQRELNETHDKVSAFWDDADVRYPDAADLPSERKDEIVALNKRRAELETRIAEGQQNRQMRDTDRERSRASRVPASPLVVPGPLPTGRNQPQTMQNLAETFLQSPEWRDYFAAIAPNGFVGERTRVQSPIVNLGRSFLNLVTGTSSTSAGAFIVADDTGIYNPLGRRPLTIRDLVSNRTTASDLVEYVRMTSRTNNAAPVAEATASSGSSGVKPESNFDFLRVSAAVKTIANWTPITRRALSDEGQMRGIIDQELKDNLEEVLEDQMLNGDGVGENFEGLDTVSGTQDQAWDTDGPTTTRKARTKMRTVGRVIPTAYVMNPSDWETFDLLQDNEARYFYGGPSALGTPRLWGLPVIESEAQPAGNAWLGDWRKAVLWDREQAMISITDSHLDFFVRNLLAILAESRHAFGIIQPSAFIEIDLTA